MPLDVVIVATESCTRLEPEEWFNLKPVKEIKSLEMVIFWRCLKVGTKKSLTSLREMKKDKRNHIIIIHSSFRDIAFRFGWIGKLY